MEKIKVLQVNKMYYPVTGGIERVVQQIAEGLKDQVDMKVLVCREKGKGAVEEIHGVEVHRASSFGILFSMPISLSFFGRLRKLSKDRDILHFHMPFPLGDAAYLLSGFKGKVVVWWHSDIVRQKKLMRLYQPIMEKMLQRADVIIVATKGHIEGSDYLGPYREKCVVIPFAVTDFLSEKAQEAVIQPVRETERIRFLFVGRMVYYKGCEVLLDAFKDVQGAELVMVGSGPLEDSLKEQVQRLNMKDRVKFLGNLSDNQIAGEFENCDVFVLPSTSKSEAFGIVQIEAMAYGKPVINTRLNSGVPFVSLDGETGLTVPAGDVGSLRDAMQRMVDDSSLRETFGKAGRKRVKECFTTENMLRKIMCVYEGMLKGSNE